MSLHKYPEYKVTDSKLVAEVPKDWQLVPLRRLLPLIESGTSVNALDNQPEEGKPSVLKTSCVYTSRFRREECKEIVEEELGRATCPVKKDSLIVSRMNTPDLVGAAGLADSDIDHLYLPDRLWQVRIGELIPAFAYYWTQSKLYRDQVKAACSGTSSSMQNLSQDAFVSFFLCRPEPEEQLAIANFLDRETAKIDALIAEQQRLIELLQEKRQAVISHAVTKGLNPNAPMKDSGVEWLGEVPEHWEIKPLKRLACIDNSGCYGEEEGLSDIDLPVATTAQIDSNGKFIVKKMPVRSFTLEEAARYSCNPRDILVVKSSGSAANIISGKAGLVSEDTEQFVFSNFLLRARPLQEHSARYVYFLLRSSLTRSRVEKMCSTTTYPNLQVGIYCSAHLPIPPLREQREIADYIGKRLEDIDNLVNHADASIALMEERLSALISAAVTGQIDVREFVAEAVGQ